jgi:hypothetical protein
LDNVYLFIFLSGYREADGLTALSIAAGKKHKPITEILASKLIYLFNQSLYFFF